MKSIPKPQVRSVSEKGGGAAARILQLRPAWATFLGLFCQNYAYYFLLTWLPSYLVLERKFSMQSMAVVGALPFCATAIASLAAGHFADRRIRAGMDSGRVRKAIAVSGLLLCAATLPFAAFAPTGAAVVCLIIAFSGIGLFSSSVWAITQTLAGKEAAGTWTGMQNAVGNMGGVIAPVATAWIYERSGSFAGAFLVSSAMLVLAAVSYGLVIGRIVPALGTGVDAFEGGAA